MALPKLNEVPNYELVIPSTGKTVTYRPFLVKEQKVLLMALESEDEKQIVDAMMNTIKACLLENIQFNNLTSFDVEYIFVQIRGKSVGETSDIVLPCKQCEENNEIKIKLDDIKVEIEEIDNQVQLTEKYTLVLKYPKYNALASTPEADTDTATLMLYTIIKNCLDELRTDEDIIKFDDESQEEINNFVENLTGEQFNKIVEFVQKIPALTHTVNFECKECNHKNEYVLRGAQDFF